MDIERKLEICKNVRQMIVETAAKLSTLTGKQYELSDAVPYYENFTSHTGLLHGLKLDIEALKKLYREYEIAAFGLTEFESLLTHAKKYSLGDR